MKVFLDIKRHDQHHFGLKLYKVMCKRIVCIFWQYFEFTDKNKKGVVLRK